jgi:twitching motility protein PilT
MIALKSLLSSLQRPEVAEVVLRGGRRPLVRVGGASEEIDAQAISGDDILAALFSSGGSRHLETLADKPAQWRTRIDGVGAVVISAAMHGDVIEARFALRDPLPQVTPAPQAQRGRASSIPPARARVGEGHGSKSLRPPPSNRRGAHHDDAAKPPKGHRDAPPSTRRGRGPRGGEQADAHARTEPPPPAEVELDLGAGGIPSVPGPAMVPFEHPPPETPRTMPEAGYGRPEGRNPTPAVRSQRSEPRVEMEGYPQRPAPRAPTPAARPWEPRIDADVDLPPPRPPLPTIPSEIDVEAAFELDEPALGDPRTPPPAARPVAPAAPVAAQNLAPPPPPPRPEEPPHAAPHPAPEPAPALEPFAPSQRRPSQEIPQRRPPEEPPPKRTTTGRTTRPFAREPHTALWQKLVRAARDVRASDLHVVAGRPALYRVAGHIVPDGDALDPLVVEDMILSRVPSRAAPALDAEGSCTFAIQDHDLGRLRVHVACHRGGVEASLRLVPTEIPTIAGLGLPDAVGAVTFHRRGLVLVAGPAGHGKTATVAAIVGQLNRDTTRHIVTIEDPIEHVHPRGRALLRQREIGVHARSVPAAIEAAVRGDADVVVVDGLRDVATARAVLVACDLGRLVIVAMNAPSAARAIDRIIDLFPPPDRPPARGALAAGLRLIVCQRLLPDAESKHLVAAAEVLPAMVPLAQVIREEDRTYQIARLEQNSKHLGVVRLDDALAELVRAGKTTAAAALAVAEAPEEMEAVLGVRRTNAPPRGTVPVRPDMGALDRPPGRATEPRPPGTPPDASPGGKGFFDNIFRKKGS